MSDGINGLAGTADTLVVSGDAGDGIDLSGSDFQDTGDDVTIRDDGYSVYNSTNTDATLLVDTDISVSLA